MSPDLFSFQVGSGGLVSFALPVPNLAALLTIPVFTQAMVFDRAANGLGMVASKAAVAAFR